MTPFTSTSQSIARRIAEALALVMMAFLSMGALDASAIDEWDMCTAPGVTPGSDCSSITLTDWQYYGIVSSDHVPGGGGKYYPSLAALISAAQTMKLANPSNCAFDQTGIQMDIGDTAYWGEAAIRYEYGSDVFHQHRVYFQQTSGNSNNPCSNQFPVTLYVAQSRQILCPKGYSRIYTAGPPSVGPYCARRWTSIDEAKCPGGCGKGQITKGNPINLVTGHKLQNATDYSTPGSPLAFRRYYNSRYAASAGAPIDLIAPPFIVGTSWSADYFQKIVYMSVAGKTSAFAYRPDFQRVIFNESGGEFAGPVDLDFRLQATKAGGVITGWVLTTPTDTTESYDANGLLLEITDRRGVKQILSYDGSGRLITVTDSFGRQLAFTYNENGDIATLVQPDGNSILYGYSGRKLMNVTDALGNMIQYHHTSGAYLTGITDENAQRYSTYTYDSLKRLQSTELAGGASRYTFSYPHTITTRAVTDPLGKVRNYGFAVKWGLSRLVSIPSITGGGNESKALTYTTNANISSRKDFNNRLTCYAYDDARNLETTRVEGFTATVTACPAGLASYSPTPGTRERKVTTTWHPTFRLPATITEDNRSTSFTYDTNGNLLTRTVSSVSPSVSRTWTYTYNAFGQVLMEDGPRTDVSDITTYSYYTCTTGYQCGQLNTITNALGHTTTYDSYNAHGQPTHITDANGLVTTLSYDARQRLTDRCAGGTLPSCAGGQLTHLDYWPTGLLKKVTNPDASFIEYVYDAAHRLTEVRDGAFNRVVYALDAMGNRTAENIYDPSSALRRTHSRVYNTLNQLWQDVNAAGTAAVTTTFAYDSNGNQTSVAAPLGRNSSNLYDELNRLKQITDPASGITQFGYDGNDNLTSVTDPRSLVTSYSYSGLGDLLTQSSPDTGLTTNTYDSGGNLDTSIDSRGVVTDYDYDAANRVTSASFTLGGVTDQTITYTYDAGTNQNGHLTGASDADHDLAWTYDTHGRVTGEGQTVGGVTLAMGYGYNAAGQLAQTVLPSGNEITYGYNSNGQVTSVTLNGSTTILSGITYDPFGPITGWTWGNGTSASRGFDTDGKVTQVDNANGANHKNYAYDDAFRITGISDAADPALSWTYGYDALDRLNSATSASVTQGWTYDANGNRLNETGSNPSSYTNSGTSNRVSAISGALSRSYGYDSAGNTLSYASATFTYDHRGRMVTASSGGVTATYTYNALGQRIRRATSSATTLYMYDGAGHLAGEYTAGGTLIQETVWLGNLPIATLRPNGPGGVAVFYVHADHLHTPRVITDTSNNLRWKWDSDPFGAAAPNENPAGLGAFEYNLRLPGQQYDAITGLHYNYFRDYDPATGRYVQSDPVGLRGGLNTFGYVRARPAMSIDPLGLAEPRSRPRIPGIPTLPGPFDILTPYTPANDAWVNNANQAIHDLLNPPSQLKDSRPKDGQDDDEDDADNWCPGPGGTTCPEWKTRVLIYYDQVVTLEIIVGQRNDGNRALYAQHAREYNLTCGLISGRVPDAIFDTDLDGDSWYRSPD